MRLGWRHHHHRVNLRQQWPEIRHQMCFINAQLAGGIEPLGFRFRHEQFHRQRMQIADMVEAPAAQSEQ